MAPRHIPAVKSVIAGTRLSEAEGMVRSVLALCSDTEVEDLVMGTMRQRFPLEMGSPAPGDDSEASASLAHELQEGLPTSVFRRRHRGQRHN
jgi:hypothetical protein